MNNETKEQLQSLSDNMSNLNYDEILFRSDILLRSIELITLIKRIEPEDFDEMINMVLLQSLKIKYKVYNPSCS